jgi:transcriptional regulator with XRE-family HTH domain
MIKEPVTTVSDIVAENVRALRKARGWSARQLAEECVKAGNTGVTMSGPAIANIETGRRNNHGERRRQVTADELLGFAIVFDVPPTALLVPPTTGPDDRINVGDRTMSAKRAWDWLEGREGVPPRRRKADSYEERERGERYALARPLWLREIESTPAMRALKRLAWRVEQAVLAAARGDGDDLAGQVGNAESAAADVLQELRFMARETN